MSRVILVVEGPTEQIVIRDVVAPPLARQGIYVTAAQVGRPGQKGGVRSFVQVANDLARFFKQESDTLVGTFFDYYGLPPNWPGLAESKMRTDRSKAKIVEQAMLDAMVGLMGKGFRPERFIPYVQLHEIEALLFVDPCVMAETFENPRLAGRFEEIVAAFKHDCEMINDDPSTAPSKQIKDLYPRYQKGKGLNAHAPMILSRIGIDRLCTTCKCFGEWYGKLSQA